MSVSARSIAHDGWALVRDPGFIGYTGVAAFFNCTFFTFVGGAPHVVVTVMGLSAKTYGLWFALIAFGYMIGNAISGRFSQRFGIDRMLRFGVLLGLVGAILQFALMALNMINTPFGLFLPQAIIAVGNGLVLPSAYAGAVSVNPRIAGSASGLTGSVQMLLAAIMSQFSGMAVGYTLSGSPMIIMISVEAILAFLTYLYLRRYLASVAA
ncbi:MAG: MFS transporter, partial [Alphaproteobacteria bacterium]|jgi:DHA1 family bicyclomycin/chloramphenicol resistance-like MFS transporter